MTNLLANGIGWLADRLIDHAATTITYKRGTSSVTLSALVGETTVQVADDVGIVRMEWTARRYIMRATDLVLAGEQTTPQRGDRIEETDGATTRVYEVVDNPGGICRDWSDPYHTMVIAYAKLIT
jgi:hypothetical protein